MANTHNGQHTQRALGVLGMAFGAGVIVLGHQHIVQKYAHRAQDLLLLIIASDASIRERARFLHRFRDKSLPVYDVFSSAQLGKAVGHESVVFAAAKHHGLVRVLHQRMQELSFSSEYSQLAP